MTKQIFTNEETKRLQALTGIKHTRDSVTLISALLSLISADQNNKEAIELYKQIMFKSRFATKENN